MPRYFFDLHIDGKAQRDDTGVILETMAEVRRAAQKLLPAIGYEEIPADGDRMSIVVFVTDMDSRPVYSATLSYSGFSLLR
ncbi:DUF6894 family protein [Methylobacterium sp. CM6241]